MTKILSGTGLYPREGLSCHIPANHDFIIEKVDAMVELSVKPYI